MRVIVGYRDRRAQLSTLRIRRSLGLDPWNRWRALRLGARARAPRGRCPRARSHQPCEVRDAARETLRGRLRVEAKRCGPCAEPADSQGAAWASTPLRAGRSLDRQAVAVVSVSGRFAFGWMPYISLTRSLARDTSHRIDDLSTRFEGEIAGTAHATTNGSSLVLSRSASVAGSEPPSFRKVSGGSPAARAAYAWAEWAGPHGSS